MSLELSTARLRLRPVEEDDLDAMLGIRNAPAVIGTTGTGLPLPRETMAGQLGRRVRSWAEQGYGSWLVLLADEPVAYVELTPIGPGEVVPEDVIEIGVVVHPDHWGRGLAVEAGMAAVRDLADRLGVERVYAGVDAGNAKSLRALAKVPGVRRVDAELYEISTAAGH